MASRLPPLLLLATMALAAATVVLGGSSAAGQPPPTVFVHLSDIHYSTNVHGKYWRSFGDREGDAALWATQLVPRLGPPAALLVTGDITDSKTARGEGLQQEEEWLGYARLLSNLTEARVPLDRVWDVPGNHDTFNMPRRGGPNDFFGKHAAEGRRRSSPQQRVFLHRLAGPPAGGEQLQEGAPAGCPAAWVLGIDPTPEPGLRSPTNFAGIARPALLKAVNAALVGLREQHPKEGCGPPLVLAYCHYPLSTIDSSPVHSPGPPGVLLHASHSALAMQGLTQLLAAHNVSAVFSGHLHSAFGQRLHRVHTTPSGGRLAELETAAWKDDRRFRLVSVDAGALTFLDLMFHTRNAPLMPGRSDAAAMQAPDWQEAYAQRGWAVTSLDPSAAVIDHIAFITSPTDGRYSSLGAPAVSQQQRGDREGSSQDAQGQGDEGRVRALVFPLDSPLDSPEATDPLSAGQVEAELAGYLPGGMRLFSHPMQQVASSGGSSSSSSSRQLLFEGKGETTISCVGRAGDPAAQCFPPAEHVFIQVSVKGASGRTSRSPQQPVKLRCAPLTASHQRCWVAAVEGEPLPLGVTLLEWMGLAFNWPVLVHRLFLLAWAFQVGGLLVAPRLLGRHVLPRIAASPMLQCHSGTEPQLPSTPKGAPGGGGVAGVAAQAGRAVLGYLLWPLAALFLCASVTEVWTAMLAYSLYLLVGPWCWYTALSGYPDAMMFHFGVMGRLDGRLPPAASGWQFISTPDTMFVSQVHFLVCLLPATFWVACVVARRVQLQPYSGLAPAAAAAAAQPVSRSSSSESNGDSRRRMEAGGGSYASLLGGSRRGSWGGASSSAAGAGCAGGGGCRWSFSIPQLAALAGLAAFNWLAVYHKAWSLMGPAALLMSPGLAWTLPLALLLVVVWGGPRRPCGRPGKGE